MINAACIILDNCGIPFSANKISRMARRFKDRAPGADEHMFLMWLANEVRTSASQKRAAAHSPDIARVIDYADPTGETAVHNVMRETA